MRLATIISLGASTALGVGALIVARIWMPSHTAAAAPLAPPPEQGVPVVVAAEPIPYGVKLEPKYLKVVKLPPSAAPSGAFGTVGQILGQQEGPPTALVPMQIGEPVLPAKLTGVGERATLAALITPGMRAYTIGVNEVSGAAGQIMPGDRVDVILTREASAGLAANGAAEHRLVSSVILQNLKVLGIDQNDNPTTTTPAVARAATLEVTVENTERLAVAAQTGSLSLALRKTGAMEVQPVRAVVTGDLGPGGAPARAAAPVRSQGAPVVRAAPEGPSVVIVNGDTVAKVKVPAEGAAAGLL
jgi:pilus assembly protein CpaB